MIRFNVLPAPFGSVGFVATRDCLHHVVMTGRTPAQTAHWLARQYPDAEPDDRLLAPFARQLRSYLDGKRVEFRVRVNLDHMTDFQRRVLEACAQVGYGQRITYGDLARRVGHPRASRAVGAALGRNPVPLAIPCHRIVGCNGSLGGFSAEQGIAVKKWLLDLESDSGVGPASCRSGRVALASRRCVNTA